MASVQLHYYSFILLTYTGVTEQKKTFPDKHYMKQRNCSAVSHLFKEIVVVVLFCEIFCTLCDVHTLPKTIAFSNILSICFPSKPHLLMSSSRVEEFHVGQQLTIGLLPDRCYAICSNQVSFQFGEALDNVWALMIEFGVICHFNTSWKAKEDSQFFVRKSTGPRSSLKALGSGSCTSCVTLTEAFAFWQLSPLL